MNYIMFQRVAERLRSEGRVRVFLFAQDNQGRDVLPIYEPFGFRAKDLVSAWRARLQRFDAFVTSDSRKIRNRSRYRIHIFHGISFKGRAFRPNMVYYDRLFLFGEYHHRRFIEAGIFKEGDPRLAMIGMPKADALFDGSLNKEEIQRRLGIDPRQPTILYAPTWGSRSSLKRMGLHIIETSSRMEVNLLIKLHDETRWPRVPKFDWPATLTALQRQGKRFTWVTEPNVMPLLYIADVLISDASSVANEFALLDRPIVFIDVPELIERYAASIDLDTWGRKTGYVVDDPAALEGTIRQALEHPEEHSAIRRAAAADYFHDPGRATERAVDAIYQLLGVNKDG